MHAVGGAVAGITGGLQASREEEEEEEEEEEGAHAVSQGGGPQAFKA